MNPQKYPKTRHIPWSPNKNVNQIDHLDNLIGQPIMILEKMDGANCLMNSRGVYSRSCQGIAYGDQWNYVKGLHAGIQSNIIQEFSIFGENLFAKHAIQYHDLPEYIMLFGIRNDEDNTWLRWEAVEFWANLLNLPTVPVLFQGTVNTEEELVELTNALGNETSEYGEREGLVIRNYEGFPDGDFQVNVAKWVRSGHVKGQHWSKEIPVKNVRSKHRQPCKICGVFNGELTLVRGQGFFCQEHILIGTSMQEEKEIG